MSLIKQHDALLLDLDGTVWEGGRAIDGAVDFINSCALPSIYVTNNASRAPEIVAEKLSAIALKATADDVLTSAQAAVTLAGEHVSPGAKSSSSAQTHSAIWSETGATPSCPRLTISQRRFYRDLTP